MELVIDDFTLTFDHIRHETFETPHYHGVTFLKDGYRYEVIRSLIGVRLLINHETQLGFFRDMPFHQGTWRFLPEEVQVTRPSTTG